MAGYRRFRVFAVFQGLLPVAFYVIKTNNERLQVRG